MSDNTIPFPERDKTPYEGDTQQPWLNVAICVSSSKSWSAEFGHRLSRFMCAIGATLIKQGVADIYLLHGDSKHALVLEALQRGATHILWLDSSVTRFPMNLLNAMLYHNQPVVAINGVTRRFPIEMTALKHLDLEHGRHTILQTSEESTGLEEVEGCEFSVALMQTKIFEKIAPPAFLTTYDKSTGRWQSEDVYFCRQARAAGYRILVDHDLSKQIGHTGAMEYRLEHARALRECEVESGVSGIVVPPGIEGV
jgi:hypothetical protein